MRKRWFVLGFAASVFLQRSAVKLLRKRGGDVLVLHPGHHVRPSTIDAIRRGD